MKNDWPVSKIGEFANVKGGKRLPKGKVVLDDPTPFRYIRVTDFDRDGLDPSSVKFIDEEAQSKVKRYTISDEDVYISIAGTIGLVGIVPRSFDGANLTENAAKICEIQDHVDERFLMYFLRGQYGQAQIAGKTVGTSQPKLALFRIKDIDVPLPDLPTQRRIAGILSAYDDLIENNLRRIRILEEMAQSLYREWFVHFRIPSEVLQKAGLPPEITLVDSPLGPIPDGWEVKAAADLAKITIGKTPPRKEPHWFTTDETGVPWVSIKDMNAGRFLFATAERLTAEAVKKFNVRVVPSGTVLMSFKLTVGRVGLSVGDAATNEAIAHFPLAEDAQITPEFLFCYLTAFQFETLGSTSSIGRAINSKIVKAMPVLVPPAGLIESFSAVAGPVFDQLKSLAERNQTLRQTRDLLLPKLLSPS